MTTTTAIRHRVADFDAWRRVFDEHGAVRKEHHQVGESVLRAADDPNSVLVLLSWPSPADAQGFLGDPSLREAMSRAGVIGAPRIEVYEESPV